MLTLFPSVSKNETYAHTQGMSIGAPTTSPQAFFTSLIASFIFSTAMTTDGSVGILGIFS